MAERRWTESQQHCIDARGGSVLVSAAAGSGKTAVLVERVIGLITDEHHPIDVDQLLIVTFTNAAAAEMRQRISAALTKLSAKQPHNRRLVRQQMRLPRAAIGTVHGFCGRLVREHFDELGLSPRFKIAEPEELKLLSQEALSEVVEEKYASHDADFLTLSELLGSSKNDDGLWDAVCRLYDFVQAHPDPEAWLRTHEQAYAAEGPIKDSMWGCIVLDFVREQLQGAASVLATAARQTEQEPLLEAKYRPVLLRESEGFRQLAQATEEASWDALVALMQTPPFERLPPIRKDDVTSLKGYITATRERLKQKLKKLPEYLCGTEQECREDIRACGKLVASLFDTVRRYAQRYAEKKLAANVVDFSDLEHGALHLLLDADGQRTPLARSLSERFAEVLVDEYQDTNAAQDALFAALSKEQRNFFLVGDVKQSIYGFRQAMPTLFLGRRAQYADYDGTTFPATITLANNFRSRREVTDTVNFVFRRLMSSETCGLVYDEREALMPSAVYPQAEGYETELLIIDDTDREADDSRDTAEARMIAQRIREGMSTLTVTKDGVSRPARYGDFCILLRSKRSHAEAYRQELERQGIPVWTDAGGSLLEDREVAAVAALLRLIDNPLQDIPLLAAMLSPFIGFTPDDLAAVRTATPKGALFVAVKRYMRSGDDAELRVRLTAFVHRLEMWRTLAVTLSADRLVQRLYDDTSCEAIVMAMSGGARRRAALQLFLDIARRFEQKGFRGVSAFVRYLDRVEELGVELPGAVTESGDGAVSIYSIHHSKGLEFPFVFLAGLGSGFNRESTSADVLLHPEIGAGIKRRDSERLTQWNTLPRQAVALSIRKSEYAEELRVLYVAMTRAREKLYLVTSLTCPAEHLVYLSSLVEEGQLPFPPSAIQNAFGLGDWILLAALQHPSAAVLNVLAGKEEYTLSDEPTSPWKITIQTAPPAVTVEQCPALSQLPDLALKRELLERMAYAYPYLPLQTVPTKLAASSLSDRQQADRRVASSRPAFLSAKGLTPAQRGTALHTFMQYADYAAAKTDAEAEIERLVSRGYLTAAEGRAVDRQHLRRFLTGQLYQRILQADRVHRELSFTIDWPAEQYADVSCAEKETILVQGIADCVLEEDGTLVVVDYKTDRVKTREELAERYREQLRIYAFALERVLGLPVRECLLYSFMLDDVVPVELP